MYQQNKEIVQINKMSLHKNQSTLNFYPCFIYKSLLSINDFIFEYQISLQTEPHAV